MEQSEPGAGVNYGVVLVDPSNLEKAWPMVEPFFQRVIDRNPQYVSLDSLRRGLESGNDSRLIMMGTNEGAVDMAMICEVVVCPTGKRVLMIPHLAGVNMSAWIPILVDSLYKIARDLDCFKLLISGGRPGWERAMKPYGGKLSHVVIEFDTEEYFKRNDNG
jgi:hypothetical protein